MFKKPSRTKNIRRKIEVIEDDPVDGEQEVIIKKTITSTEKKKKKDSKKAFNALSFEDEEGDVEEFQVKKTKASKTMKLQLSDDLNPLSNAMEIEQTPASYYNADALKQLRASTPSLPASVKSSLTNDESLLHEKFPSTMNATIEGVAIPDSGAILAAKKKREQMRKGFNITEQDDGFISLNDVDEEEKGGSRLVREEDDILDDGEAEFEKYVGDKFSLNKGAAKAQEKERREGVRELIEEAEDDNDNQSEDMERWEEDMMKFGGAKTQSRDFDPYAAPANYRPAQIPAEAALPSLSDVMRALNLVEGQVSDSMNNHKENLEESLKTIENSHIIEDDLEKEINRASERYNYFQELAQYVNDLGEFLDAKFPDLEKIELEVHDIIATKTEVATSRRWQNNLDDLSLFADIPSQLDEEMDEPEVDEFGRVRELRNSDAARQRRRAERTQRIEKQADLLDLTGDEAIRDQGLWTDDEMGEDYSIQKDTKLDTAQTTKIDELMADVGEEFKSLRTVKDKFEAWKSEYYEDYEKAYGSLSLPGAFEFYIRSELVSWDPFSNPMDFDSMQWHSILSEYGVSVDHEDPDIEMLNKVVEKTMIKKIKSMLDTLNAASSREMRYAAQVIEQVSYYVDTHEKAYKDLAMDIVEALEKQIIRFVDIIETSVLKSNLQPENMEAKHRFFWSQCKYLKTLMVWRRHLPKDQLDHLGSLVMNRIIFPILKPESYPTDLHLQNEALLLLSHLQK